MQFDELGEASRQLVRGRGRVLGDSLTALAREYANYSSQELAEALSKAPKSQKPGIGLLLARVALEEAASTHSRELFGRFLFRFGAHLKASVSTPGYSAAQRLALATAVERLFDALPTSSANQRSDAHAIRLRLEGPTVTDKDWQTTVGLTESEFGVAVGHFTTVLPSRRRGEKTVAVQAAQGLAKRMPRPSAPKRSRRRHPLPTWLSVTSNGEGDPLVGATANWVPAGVTATQAAALSKAWSEFREGDYEQARSDLAELQATVGADWGPTSSADSLRTWNWIRLVVELANLEAGDVVDSRRSWTSVCEYAQRSVPDSDLLERWVQRAIGDFVANDEASRRAWASYAARLVASMGHESALASYSNADKAALRATWGERFELNAEESRNTAAAASAIVLRLRQPTQHLYVGARQPRSLSRVLREAEQGLTDLLDEAEGTLFRDCADLVREAEKTASSEDSNHRDLRDISDELSQVRVNVAQFGSSMLLDFVAPILEVAAAQVRQRVERLGDSSRPDVFVRLASAKIPFSAAPGSSFQMRFIATNSGNATAEGISLRVTQPDLDLDASTRLNALGPGAEAEVNVSVVASGKSSRAVNLTCAVTWSDALLQQFSRLQQIPAEDQMEVAWTADDVNPFSLGTISDPERLVGRAEDLDSLDALLAGNASAYVTGHKRVGKTSLTRVLLRTASERRGWAGSLLPLGRALGQDQSAGELVYALLDSILDAARDTYDGSLGGISEVVSDEAGNFARAANKWLRAIARALPAEARVVIAIDDFDELPTHLVEGPQADALFLFLRSLVDEPWLNLIVVGSEVLPSIIQAQAHKLNQVVPVSVTNFASRSSTAELLETPTATRLEWMADAIDRVHYLCSGNPYYETLLAQRLWQAMRERARSVVTSSDVDEAAAAVARGASDSHFIHLWADSATGLDHTARPAIVASAVLRSIARCGGESLAPASVDEVMHLAQGWIQTASTEELKASIAGLKSRGIVRPVSSGDRLVISVPLVGTWLLGAGGDALDGVYATSKHATATVRMITDSDLVSLARNLRYKGDQITETRVKAWLEQFGGNDRQYLAFKMLRRMVLDGYFTSTRLQNIELPRLASAIAKLEASRFLVREANNMSLRNAFLLEHGVAGDSTQGTLSLLAKALKIKKANIVPASGLAEKLRSVGSDVVVFLLDDYCGTGTHLEKELEAVVSEIDNMGEEWAERIHVVVGACVVADEADLPRGGGALELETVGGTFLGDRFRPFTPDSGVFDSTKERKDALEMTESIGRALLPNNPLGFGSKALLTLFEFNCPNNVAPIFWRTGTVSGRPWVPLFERAV